MNKQRTIVIGGREYDAVTGLPVAAGASAPKPQPKADRITVVHTAKKVHQPAQRSTALNRKFVGKPQTLRTDITVHRTKPVVSQAVHATTHPQIRRFAPHPAAAAPQHRDVSAPVAHPAVAKAHALSAHKAAVRQGSVPAPHTPAADIKNEALAKAIANVPKPGKPHKTPFFKRQRAGSIIAATFAFVLLGGYFTYLNMPSLSVRVAAAQAGINAAYPDYRPDGYALHGPVTYADGRVSMNFKANASDANFTVNQSESSWDSSAVLDNHVLPKAGSSYMPFTERGLTIYTFGNNAAWVNGGILYTIDGDAPLSNEQIRRIATSLL